MMDALKLPEGAWVVVCDGQKALVMENIGDAEYPDLRMRKVDNGVVPPTSELGSDGPGRVQQSVGSRRSAVEQTDFHDEAERKFLTDLVHRLDSSIEAQEVSHLAIVAPPRALGVMRHAYTPRLRAAIHDEVDKDLTTMPSDEIERHLVGGKK